MTTTTPTTPTTTTTRLVSSRASIFTAAIQDAFHRELHPVKASTPHLAAGEVADVKAHNRARSLLIRANCLARENFHKRTGSHPTKEDLARMQASGEIKPVPPMHRSPDKHVHVPSIDEMELARIKNRKLFKRTEQEWLDEISAIEDETLRVQLAKRVWWDFFAARRWTGLDKLIHEEGSTRLLKYITKDTAPAINDLRIALWMVGYPIQTIRTQFNFDYTIVTRDD